jgi:hypothetical protein
MKCPNCESIVVGPASQSPWFLLPFRLFISKIRCDTCLTTYYRLHFIGFPFHREGPQNLPPLYP